MGEETARIRADVERSQAELGATAAELAQQLDPRVRSRRAARNAGDEVRARVERLVESARRDPRRAAAAGAAVAVLVLWRRSRRR